MHINLIFNLKIYVHDAHIKMKLNLMYLVKAVALVPYSGQ